jgi:ribonuclease HII
MTLEHHPEAAGADEAGRGPLAGPLVVAAVRLPLGFDLSGLNDSKKLDPTTRLALEARLKEDAEWAVEVVPAAEVDRLNPLRSSLEGMGRCLTRLNPSKGYVDGNALPKGLAFPVEAVVKGDGKLACIAAASILAKTERDRLMIALAEIYPGYGFERHFGYPTPSHLAALQALGPCPEHRRSYGPVKALLEQPALL